MSWGSWGSTKQQDRQDGESHVPEKYPSWLCGKKEGGAMWLSGSELSQVTEHRVTTLVIMIIIIIIMMTCVRIIISRLHSVLHLKYQPHV